MPATTERPALGSALLVVCDAHLGATAAAAEETLLAFLHDAPTLGDSLLVDGDLFDFWFAYRHALPRHAFRVAAALATLRRRMPIAMVGGNHDRWGSEFWSRDLGMLFGRDRLRFRVGATEVLALHGDGLERGLLSRALHRVIRMPLTSWVYAALHPNIGFPLVTRSTRILGPRACDTPGHYDSAERQRAWAERTLGAEPDVGLLIMGHTHRPAAEELRPGQRYLNPGAWFDGWRYGIAGEGSVELRRYGCP